MSDLNTKIISLTVFVILLTLGLAACEQTPGKSAPIGDHIVLEQLADAYRRVSQQYPMQPASMRPADKKEFVEQVFAAAGYNYTATLMAVAEHGLNVTSQDQRDLSELLFLPHKGMADTDLAELYSEDELMAIRVIQAALK